MRSLHLFWLFFLPCLTACQQAQEEGLLGFSSMPMVEQGKSKAKPVATDIVFKSIDAGIMWQDISAGLPLDTKAEGLFVSEGELLLTTTDGIYRSNAATKDANWEKERILQRPLSSVSAAPNGAIALTDNRRFFQKLKGTDVWMPIFTDFKGQFMRTVFTGNGGSTFIGSDNGLYKSTDGGKSWKHVVQNGWVIKIVESNGVLLCTNERGILRSTDGGETWDVVISEGGVGIDVATINGGFAAITYNTESETRRIRTSTDGGKTWQAIDAGLPPSSLVSTVVQLGDYFYCGHPDGIFRSADGGKSWHLAVPTVEKKVFNLSIHDGVMFAVLREGGC